MSNPMNKTGRTMRRVVHGLSAMLMGKKVLFVCGTPSQAKQAYSYAEQWLADNGWYDQKVVRLTTSSIGKVCYFGTEGELRFTCLEKSRGLRYTEVERDHSADELEEQREREMERKLDITTMRALMLKHKWYAVKLPGTFRDGSTLLIRG